jgi:hypothetical protein
MTETRLAPNLPDWMVEHSNRYLSSGGTEGHMYKMTQPGQPQTTVPSLLLTTTGRKSRERWNARFIVGDAVDDPWTQGLTRLLEDGATRPVKAGPEADTPALLLTTSGTTGQPN